MLRYTLYVVALYVLSGMARAGEFQAHVDYATGVGPMSVAAGDFNGDGKADLAVANSDDATVSVLLGNGDGSFQPHMDYAVGYSPSFVATGDFNADGKLDVVVANRYDSTLSVLLGNGHGSFHSRMDYATGMYPYSVAVGDLNGDGRADLALAQGGTVLGVLLGNGDGTFQAEVQYETGLYDLSVALGDFNNDGKADLATANEGGNTTSVLLGNGDGTFQAHVDYATGRQPFSVAVGDFNGDGRTDLVVANSLMDNSVSVLLGNGDGTFQAQVQYRTGKFPVFVAVADWNGDDKADLATANFGGFPAPASVTVLLGGGDGSIQGHVSYAAGSYPISVAVGDFNGDGAADMAVANQGSATVSVLLNTGGTFVATTSSNNPSTVGQPVTFTTTVTASVGLGRTPTGTVTFKDGTTTLGIAILVGGQASLTTSSLAVGDHTIRTGYSGSTSFNRNRAAPIIQTVTP